MAPGVILSSILLLLFVLSDVTGGDEVRGTATYDYKEVLSKAILLFEAQKLGKLSPTQWVKWWGDSTLSDGKRDNVVLIGGYYDAGNNVKFGWPMAFTITLLSWAAMENPTEISSTGQMDYLRQAISWGNGLYSAIAYLAYYFLHSDGDRDHACWERTEDMDTSRTLHEAAAALSAASIVFKTIDSYYSSKLFTHSESLFELADKYKGSYTRSCPFYCPYSGYQAKLSIGDVVTCCIKKITYFGIFVEVEGVAALIHQAEVSWDRTLEPESYFKLDKELAYQELEMGVPESASGGVNGGDVDVANGWDEGWDDDWDEDKAVVKASGTEVLGLLVINVGEKPLKVKVTAPKSWKDGFNANGIPKNQSEKINVPLSVGQSTKIVLKAGDDECVINMSSNPSLKDFMQGIPSYYKHVTPIYAAYFAFLITLVVGGIWTLCFLLKKRRQDGGGVAYQELEMGVPESASGGVNGGDVDVANGWDEGWDDDWDEDKAVVKASGNNISGNGLTARSSSNREGWENDWDD